MALRLLRAALLGLGLLSAPLAAYAENGDLATRFKVHDPMSSKTVDHSQWAEILAAHVALGADGVTRVDYAAIAGSDAEMSKLGGYIELLQDTKISTLSEDEQYAFWVNLYNAVTVEVVVEHYPVASIRDISISPGLFTSGPWGKKLVTVEGEPLSLDNIEHDILRKLWDEPRVHFAVNCASFGCPNLATEPYTGQKLEHQLARAAASYVAHPRGVQFEGNALTLSKIFDWYGKDFGATRDDRLARIASYAAPALSEKLKAYKGRVTYAYDWSLNDTAAVDTGAN